MFYEIIIFMSTQKIIYLTIAILVVYDVYIVFTKGKSETISQVLLKMAKDHPIIPFALGVIFGHIFWLNC